MNHAADVPVYLSLTVWFDVFDVTMIAQLLAVNITDFTRSYCVSTVIVTTLQLELQ